jgi:hypothetical protein
MKFLVANISRYPVNFLGQTLRARPPHVGKPTGSYHVGRHGCTIVERHELTHVLPFVRSGAVVVVPEETNVSGRSAFSLGRANIDTSIKISLEKLIELSGVEVAPAESVAEEVVAVSETTETATATEAAPVSVVEPTVSVVEETEAVSVEETPTAPTENERLEGLLSVDWENLHTLKMAELAIIGGYFDPAVARRHTKDETVSDLLDAARTAGLL